MKKSNLSLWLSGILCIAGLLAGCSSQPIVLKGKIKNAAGSPVVYYRTVDGVMVQSVDTLHLHSDSTFMVTIPVNSPEKFDFYLWGKRPLGCVYLKPGTTEIEIDASADVPFKMENTPENEVMKKLSELNNDVWQLRARKGDKWEIARDTVASSVYDKLTAYAQSFEKELAGVDEVFKNKARQDIRMQLLLAFENQYFVVGYKANEQTKQEWSDTLDKFLEFVNLNHPDNVFSAAFPDAIRNRIGIEIYDRGNPENRPKGVDESNQAYFDSYEKRLQGKVREVAMAHIILEDYQQEKYATGIPALYDRFVKLYPQSVLMPYLDEAVAKNKSFNEVAFSEDVHFIESDSIHTFKELTDLFPGKVIFVDIWATWCGPCRESFKYVKPLQKYAKENDVVLLYISIDRPTDKDKWKKMANHYDLKGEHFILNETIQPEIYDTFGHKGGLYIPHCAIINKKGEIQFKTASSPEDMDKLMEQLKEAAQ